MGPGLVPITASCFPVMGLSSIMEVERQILVGPTTLLTSASPGRVCREAQGLVGRATLTNERQVTVSHGAGEGEAEHRNPPTQKQQF